MRTIIYTNYRSTPGLFKNFVSPVWLKKSSYIIVFSKKLRVVETNLCEDIAVYVVVVVVFVVVTV